MLLTAVKTLALMAAICGLWLFVQRLWLKTMTDRESDDDALAGRGGCHGCTCDKTRCERN